MHDPRARWHHAEILECALGKLEELVALCVALELKGHILLECLGGSVVVDLHGVVDDEVAGNHRIDLRRFAAHCSHRVSHGHQVDDARHPGEILEDDSRRHERHLSLAAGSRRPFRQRTDVLLGHEPSPNVAERVLEEDPDGEGELIDGRQVGEFELGEGVNDGFACADFQRCASLERIWMRHMDALPG